MMSRQQKLFLITPGAILALLTVICLLLAIGLFRVPSFLEELYHDYEKTEFKHLHFKSEQLDRTTDPDLRGYLFFRNEGVSLLVVNNGYFHPDFPALYPSGNSGWQEVFMSVAAAEKDGDNDLSHWLSSPDGSALLKDAAGTIYLKSEGNFERVRIVPRTNKLSQ